jgi:prepilin-type N-terminal cleavage/methylation domain-containing protein
MTSVPGRTKAKACDAPGNRPCRAGFTLTEIALSLSILAVLAALSAVALGKFHDRHLLPDAAARFGGMLRMVRAEALRRGCCFRIILAGDDDLCRVQWEPDPLEAPGEFVDYSAGPWLAYLPRNEVFVVRCLLTGESVDRALYFADTGPGAPDAPAGDVILFYPDGSADSAVVELAPAEGAEARHVLVELNGLTGTVTTRLCTSAELEPYYAESAATPGQR